MFKEFKIIDIVYDKIKSNVENFVLNTYKKGGELLSKADPYGQILHIVYTIRTNFFLYLENIVTQFNPERADDPDAIRGQIRLTGHNPSRGMSATGVISLSLKAGADLTKIGASKIIIMDNTKLKNKRNGLEYTIRLNKEKSIYTLSQGYKILLNVSQGRYETQSFTGNNRKNQSFRLNTKGGSNIDNFDIKVMVNGKRWNIKDSLWDMLANEESCVIKTGLSGGVDLYFGNGNFGKIPELGSEIIVEFLVIDGESGNIPNKIVNQFSFVDDVLDYYGTPVNIEEFFNIEIDKEINFGTDIEDLNFSRNIAPYVSRNHVLANPDTFIYYLKRLNVFSYVNAFTTFDDDNLEDDNVIYLNLVPNVENYLDIDDTYFTVPLDSFYLDDYEKDKILNLIKREGIQVMNSVIQIIQPKLTKYAITVVLVIFEEYKERETEIRQEIITKMSDYFLNIRRLDRIPVSDIINIIEDIEGVDSVNAKFISESNESYHNSNNRYRTDFSQRNPLTDIKSVFAPNYNPKKLVGLNTMGDIVIGKDEYPIIRGGWKDRNGNLYANTPEDTFGISPVNILISEYSKKPIMLNN